MATAKGSRSRCFAFSFARLVAATTPQATSATSKRTHSSCTLSESDTRTDERGKGAERSERTRADLTLRHTPPLTRVQHCACVRSHLLIFIALACLFCTAAALILDSSLVALVLSLLERPLHSFALRRSLPRHGQHSDCEVERRCRRDRQLCRTCSSEAGLQTCVCSGLWLCSGGWHRRRRSTAQRHSTRTRTSVAGTRSGRSRIRRQVLCWTGEQHSYALL